MHDRLVWSLTLERRRCLLVLIVIVIMIMTTAMIGACGMAGGARGLLMAKASRRYAFRLKDLRVWRVVRSELPDMPAQG